MKYFSFIEMIKSSKAEENNIDNFPHDCSIIDNIIFTMEKLDMIREMYGKPLYVSSGYRCKELNRIVGGESNSQHLTGQAADINLGSVEKNRQFFYWLFDHAELIDFDQLINEHNFSWVHISFKKSKNRHQVIHAK